MDPILTSSSISKRGSLSPEAQRRLAELSEQLNPLGVMVARAKSRSARKVSRSADSSAIEGGSEEEVGDRIAQQSGDGNGQTEAGAESQRLVLRRRSLRPKGRDLRLPSAGSFLRRWYKGREVIVRVLESDFEYESQRFRSLSAIAKQVTGDHWNGLLFFGLVRQEK